jgi:hypothetical protein
MGAEEWAFKMVSQEQKGPRLPASLRAHRPHQQAHPSLPQRGHNEGMAATRVCLPTPTPHSHPYPSPPPSPPPVLQILPSFFPVLVPSPPCPHQTPLSPCASAYWMQNARIHPQTPMDLPWELSPTPGASLAGGEAPVVRARAKNLDSGYHLKGPHLKDVGRGGGSYADSSFPVI